jgi:hypothetical protein
MHRLREILAHGGIATLAVVFALASCLLACDGLAQQAVFALAQHVGDESSSGLEFRIFATDFDSTDVLQSLVALAIIAGALFAA